jgi:predicted DCC family thiol-disulfide oxidoreductase YuxK
LAQREDIYILYDGECPFCTRYVQWVRLKDRLTVHLVNAREESALRDEATALGHDLDRGMIVKYGGSLYHGDAAMMLLSALTTPSDMFNRLMVRLFRSKRRAKVVYPALAFARRVTVLALGRGTIRNLK